MDRLAAIALVLLFSLVWSSAFIVAKIALVEWAPLTILTIRFALAALVMAPLLFHPATNRPPTGQMVSPAEARRVRSLGLLMGVLNGAIYLGLSFSALRVLRPEVVIVVIGLTPFFTMLIAAVTGVERLSALKIGGVALGLVGVVLVSGLGTGADPDPLGLLFALGAGFAFAVGTVLFKGRASGLPVGPLAFWQSLGASLALLPAVALLEPLPPSLPSWSLTGAILYLALVVTVLGMTLWLVLVRRHGAGTAASFHLLNPVMGILLANLVLGSEILPTDLMGAAVIAVGLGLTVWTPRPATLRLIPRPLRS